MKKLISGLFFLFVAMSLQAQNLTWNIKFLQGKNRESVPVSRPVRMETGESFFITLNPTTDCFCYVVCYDAEKQIAVLKNERIKGGDEIFLDEIELTEPSGTETLYVIMSVERQAKLESLIQAFNNQPNSQQNKNNLYNEVINLQNTVSKLGEPASSFIASGGTSRGLTPEQVTQFSGKNIYVRPISIRH